MTQSRETTETERLPLAGDPSCSRIAACNRILLYGQGLGLSAEDCLELASESLRRASPVADLWEIMSTMRQILSERKISAVVAGEDGEPIRGAPPLNRSSMVSSCPDCLSLSGWVVRSALEFVKKVSVSPCKS